ncbi:MAG: hypothetical protein L0I95_12735 [Tetragenococcus koreensis]|uniref:hypothetical protein n=1 Tax=Tetragenococcus halophilus TaxID=51669 RepID=UPI001F3FA6EC|nr:hypothetical protein [Tetragenococcus halophilus]MDN6140604.1 hypothetical protein [Tetragenococcus koreensis]MDN6571296.1 hypothetical protein [Staphylococcus equorum]MCF1675979.1 hypothetical protein [Tetragenococcus halophilus]MDN6146750.1 hypothetical protein [Tetragenococcus koreensis]MDN6166808.1 hypothetical protein [Tetragenococcus koreensis]
MDRNDSVQKAINLYNALQGLQMYCFDHLSGVDELNKEDPSALAGMVASISYLASGLTEELLEENDKNEK